MICQSAKGKWASRKKSLILGCIRLEKSASVRNSEEDSSQETKNSESSSAPWGGPGRREWAEKSLVKSQRSYSFIPFLGHLQQGQRKINRGSEKLSPSECFLCCCHSRRALHNHLFYMSLASMSVPLQTNFPIFPASPDNSDIATREPPCSSQTNDLLIAPVFCDTESCTCWSSSYI